MVKGTGVPRSEPTAAAVQVVAEGRVDAGTVVVKDSLDTPLGWRYGIVVSNIIKGCRKDRFVGKLSVPILSTCS